MFCIHCGTEASSGDRFCRSCGRELSAPPSNSTEPAAPIPPGGQPGPTWSGQPRPAPGLPAYAPPPARVLPGGIAEIAPIGVRVGAFALDLLFLVLTWFGAVIAVAIVYFATSGIPEDNAIPASDEESLSIAIWALAAPIIFVGTWMLNSTGGSLGKRALGLRIVRADGQAPGLGWGLGRTVTAWLSWIPLGLGFLWATWDEQTQTWHDKMCGTYVVRAASLRAPQHPEGGSGSLH